MKGNNRSMIPENNKEKEAETLSKVSHDRLPEQKEVEQLVWKMIETYFRDNPQALVNHHVESYNDFFEQGIYRIFREKNPLKWATQYDETIEAYRSQCIMYMGGKDGSKIYFGKPVIYDENTSHYMFPNEARLRNMTYGMTIHYDIEIEFLNILNADSVEAATSGDFVQTGGYMGVGDVYDLEDELSYNEAESSIHRSLDNINFLRETGMMGGAPPTKKTNAKANIAITPSDAKTIREYIEQSVKKDPVTGLIIQKRVLKLERVFLGKFPIMAQSKFCILNGTTRETRYTMGECRNDPGGYFIIDGKEKVVIPQEKFGDNMMYIRRGTPDADDYLYSVEIKSVSENVTKPVRTLNVRMVAPTGKYTFANIVVNIPNVRKPVPLFILFRALGVLSDREIITTILLDMDKYQSMVDLFAPSIHDAGLIYTQRNAIEYIAYLTKGKAFHHGLEILADYFLPHVGETNFREKAYFLGYMVFRMLSVHIGLELPTDRDNFKYKRLELPGNLIYELFREYYTIQLKKIHLMFETELNLNLGNYERDMPRWIQDHQRDIFREGGRIVEDGFKKAFKGNWGAYSHTKRIGVIQDLNRLSYNTMISHLRKTNLPIDSSLKLVGPRMCHNSQWGFIDPLDTPDGGNIGIHKNLAITTTISRGYSRDPMIEWLREMVGMRLLTDHVPFELSMITKVMVNGYWAGCVTDPVPTVEKIRTYRRTAMLPIDTSVTFDFKLNIIYIYTDAGRLCRPIFYVDNDRNVSCMRSHIASLWKQAKTAGSWDQLTRGFHAKRDAVRAQASPFYTKLYQVYEGVGETIEQTPDKLREFLDEQAVVDYIDSSETENTFIAMNVAQVQHAKGSKHPASYTHCEIHASLLLGVMGNQITYPEMNQFPRDLFSCGQSKQACSLYHTNYQMRMDKTAVVLHYGQIPLVKTRYMNLINQEENPYGFNAMVAIACYGGYNVEDAILINGGSIARGMFRTTYLTSYYAHEERGDPDKSGGELPVNKLFTNIEHMSGSVVGLKPGYDYSQLDDYGIIREGTPVNDKTVLIGLSTTSPQVATRDLRTDASVGTKKGQLGYVDKTYMTEGEEGERIAKVRIREERIPTLGDKFAGRAGQKGTVGMVIPEEDMPFTKDGLRPDIIINPHAIPSRMTVGQLVESLTGKSCNIFGGFADCTAFGQNGSKVEYFGQLLHQSLEEDEQYESYGNEILYNGMTGEQIESSIFLGPVYYMRLKHMVKDKQQSRCLGPRSALTKQPVGGRANDGGLRIGEMERDSVLAHGASAFLKESMMERGDKYYIAVCNKTGVFAIYNPAKNLFMSPLSDGPIKFMGDKLKDASLLRVETVTKFGRDFSIVEIPYTLKLMIQELQTINVQMRIITEDNIRQLENLSYSKIPDPAQFKRKLQDISKAVESKDAARFQRRVQDAIQSINPRLESPGSMEEEAYVPDSPKTMEYQEDDEDEWKIIEDKMLSPDIQPEVETETKAPDSPKRAAKLDVANFPSDDKDIVFKNGPETTQKVGIPEGMRQATKAGSYETRQFVHLKGDTKPDRIWMIEDIMITPRMNAIYTLITNDHEGLKKVDQIQVVKESRLVPMYQTAEDDHPPTESMKGGGTAMLPWRTHGGGSEDLGDMGRGGGMVFAPIMVNGGSVGLPLGENMVMGSAAPMSQPGMPPPPIPLNHMGGGNHAPPTHDASSKSADKPAKKDDGGGGGGFFGGAMDFAKVLIRKVT